MRSLSCVDFKPTYGLVFQDYISNYEFWGYCDTDMIWGHIRDFITPEVLDHYDRIRNRGHLVLVRNNEKNNLAYQSQDPVLPYTYQIALNTQCTCHFDENPQWPEVFRKEGLRYWSEPIAADICPEYYTFRLAEQPGQVDRSVFRWTSAGLQRYWLDHDQVQSDTWCYLHLQKRDMAVHCDLAHDADITIVPNQFLCTASVKDWYQLLMEAAEERFYLSWHKKKWRSFIREKMHGSFIVSRRRKLDRLLAQLHLRH